MANVNIGQKVIVHVTNAIVNVKQTRLRNKRYCQRQTNVIVHVTNSTSKIASSTYQHGLYWSHYICSDAELFSESSFARTLGFYLSYPINNVLQISRGFKCLVSVGI